MGKKAKALVGSEKVDGVMCSVTWKTDRWVMRQVVNPETNIMENVPVKQVVSHSGVRMVPVADVKKAVK